MQRDLLRQLAAFHAVGTEGTISAAARRLGKSPPAVHHDLRRLEGRLGEPLFQRSGRYLRLTPQSRQLHLEVGRALDKIERDLDRFSRAALVGGTLRIGAVAGFGRYRLAPALLKSAGEMQIDMFMGAHQQVVDMLVAGRIDVGVTYRPVVESPVNCEFLAEEEFVLIGSAGAEPVGSAAEAVEQLKFVTYDEYKYVFGIWFSELLGSQPVRLNRSDHTSELEEALTSVAAGRGATIAPADAWLAGQWRDRCAQMLVPLKPVRNPLFLLSMTGQPPRSAEIVRGLFEPPQP